MDIYLVGGAVRDELLGLPVKDRDWVVVGAKEEEFLANGYQQVGKDFPIFLHPKTQEEYALARTERKTSGGYYGFAINANIDVTLEQDLARRDLTINAIAKDKNGRIIDPYNGQDDLKKGILRHVSSAFCEDPVRILRLARFAARFGFSVADETMILMRKMVEQKETDYLIAERVWQEISKGLMEQNPFRMFDVLHDCSALSRIAPEINQLFEQEKSRKIGMKALDLAAKHKASLPERFALLCLSIYANTYDNFSLKSLSKRWKVPKESYDLSNISCRYHSVLSDISSQSAQILLQLLKSSDALRRPQRFLDLLEVCHYYLIASDTNNETKWLKQKQLAQQLLKTIQQINFSAIANLANNKKDIPYLIDNAKLKAIELITK